MLIATSLIRFLSYNEVDTLRYAATGGLSKLFVDIFWQDKTLCIACKARLRLVYNARIKRIETSNKRLFVLERNSVSYYQIIRHLLSVLVHPFLNFSTVFSEFERNSSDRINRSIYTKMTFSSWLSEGEISSCTCVISFFSIVTRKIENRRKVPREIMTPSK